MYYADWGGVPPGNRVARHAELQVNLRTSVQYKERKNVFVKFSFELDLTRSVENVLFLRDFPHIIHHHAADYGRPPVHKKGVTSLLQVLSTPQLYAVPDGG